jgi:hypothetical protein
MAGTLREEWVRRLNATNMTRTESEFEEVHRQRDRLGVGISRVGRELAVCIRWWWNITAEGWV